MPRFSYKVRDREDRVVLGTMEAPTADEVIDRLAQGNLLPILVEEIGVGGTSSAKSFRDQWNESMRRRATRVPYKDVVFFTRQLATMVGQGVPLARCLEQLQKDQKPVFRKIIQQLSEDISTGITLSDAIARHPGAFNSMYVAVTHSGEVAGALDRVLDGMANYMENVEIMRGKVKAAMRYPVIIGVFVALMLAGIMWWLVPTFESIYSSMHAKLPAPTQMLISVSRLLREHTLPILGATLVLLLGFLYAMSLEPFKIFVEHNLLRAPVFGGIMRKNIWGTYSRTMALLMEAGTPILKATEIAGATVNNRYFMYRLQNVHASLKKGELLSDALQQSGLFPALVVQLVSTGETTGRVDALLRKAAEFYEREIRNVVDSLSSIIQPILIIVLGGVVGLIIFALYLPIFQVGQFVK